MDFGCNQRALRVPKYGLCAKQKFYDQKVRNSTRRNIISVKLKSVILGELITTGFVDRLIPHFVAQSRTAYRLFISDNGLEQFTRDLLTTGRYWRERE